MQQALFFYKRSAQVSNGQTEGKEDKEEEAAKERRRSERTVEIKDDLIFFNPGNKFQMQFVLALVSLDFFARIYAYQIYLSSFRVESSRPKFSRNFVAKV